MPMQPASSGPIYPMESWLVAGEPGMLADAHGPAAAGALPPKKPIKVDSRSQAQPPS